MQHSSGLVAQRPAIDDAGANTGIPLAIEASIEVGQGFLKHHAAASYQNSVSQTTKTDESHASHNTCQNDMLAVCIMGQLSRLEVRSKIANLLQPEALRRTTVDVFMVLETDADFYVNQGTIQSSGDVCHTDFKSVTDVEDAFSPFYKTGLYVNPGKFEVNMSNWKDYGQDKSHYDDKIRKRMVSHFSQWNHLSQCAQLIKEQELIRGCQYEGAVKMRDNTIVAMPMPPIEIGAEVMVKECSSWGGINDKTFITPRAFLEACFEGPLRMAVRVNKGLETDLKLQHPHGMVWPNSIVNPEEFLQFTFERNGVQWKPRDGTNTMVDGRCLGADGLAHRAWCLVEDWKDCHPKGESSYATCDSSPNVPLR